MYLGWIYLSIYIFFFLDFAETPRRKVYILNICTTIIQTWLFDNSLLFQKLIVILLLNALFFQRKNTISSRHTHEAGYTCCILL